MGNYIYMFCSSCFKWRLGDTR